MNMGMNMNLPMIQQCQQATPSQQDWKEAAEALTSILSVGKGDSSNVANGSLTSENSLAPQKVRTERYVKVSVKGFSMTKQKSLFLSWFIDNNGLPDACLLLIPERHPNVIISFKVIIHYNSLLNLYLGDYWLD